MTSKNTVWYDPALRMKAGELEGLGGLAPDIADRTLPRMIVPPPEERDENLQAALFEIEAQPEIGKTLAAVWPRRDVLIDPTFLLDEFERSRSGMWLPKMIESAWKRDVQAIPLAQADDFLADDVEAFKAAASHPGAIKLGILIPSDDLTDVEVLNLVIDKLSGIGLDPKNCLITADFSEADFTQPDFVAEVIEGVLDTLKESALWKQVVFQGTNYPEKNPALPGGYYQIPRNEWIAWRRAVKFDPQTAEEMIFGDYAADCAKMKFGGKGGRAIRHYRYATSDAWYIQRGQDTGTHDENMRAVCMGIVASGLFAGREFSSADDQIYLNSRGLTGPGNAKNWRAVNTTHHITRVVTDIGAVRGVTFAKKVVSEPGEQIDMFALAGR
jgi:hypothetical protein